VTLATDRHFRALSRSASDMHELDRAEHPKRTSNNLGPPTTAMSLCFSRQDLPARADWVICSSEPFARRAVWPWPLGRVTLDISATVEPRNHDFDYFCSTVGVSRKKDFTEPQIKKCHRVADHDQTCSL
jgi:hypothetical protein